MSDDESHYEIEASLRSLDRRNIFDPTLTFALSDGLDIASALPEGCTLEPQVNQITCILPLYTRDAAQIPTEWIGLTIAVRADPDIAQTQTVAVTATSLDNPATNDPDPTNNTVEVTLG